MKKRACTLFISLIASLFFLVACSQQNQKVAPQTSQNTSQASPNANHQSSTYYPGKIIWEEGSNLTGKDQYVYGGIVSNSIVIHIVFNNANSMSLYFPAHKGTIITLPGTKRQFVVDYVDWQKGTIKMH